MSRFGVLSMAHVGHDTWLCIGCSGSEQQMLSPLVGPLLLATSRVCTLTFLAQLITCCTAAWLKLNAGVLIPVKVN